MKSKFSHSSVEIIEYPFEKVYLDELNEELIKNINLLISMNIPMNHTCSLRLKKMSHLMIIINQRG